MRFSIAWSGLQMDAREQLKRYLEQRRETGETDLVLDRLSVSDALRLLGAAPTKAKHPPEQSSSDWREVLRSAGAAPTSLSAVSPPLPAPPIALPTAGLSVGDADRELFGGPMAQLDSLDAVARVVASCTRCPLYATAKNPVPGQGNPNADLMIVGEAPGATEDEKGLAFVGAAGQLLTKILAAVDLKREDVFICNVLKHRPPGNRNPMPDEVTACTPYLLRQFELIRPKAILALGTFAAQTLLQTKLAIGKLRNQVHRFHGVPLIVTYHPAALLRNPSWKRPTWEDVQLVRRILDSSAAKP
jgi:uracil-DNA glycosylase